ncbi:MAG TPA: hypothetical protein VFC00_04355 [Micromonosporaceae bacterium]|nr:hypothetical protein [Micromonosporaceae bacterium]
MPTVPISPPMSPASPAVPPRPARPARPPEPPPGRADGAPWLDLTITGEQRRMSEDELGLRPATPAPRGRMAEMGATVGRWRAGARSELRRQLREVQRMRRITLVAVVMILLGAYPGYLLTQVASRDPVFNSLDTLDVPDWATGDPTDVVFGSRWCIKECRFRERNLVSQRPPEETAQVYERALQNAGWRRWLVAGCPTDLPGYTCWKRDEFTLDLYVREPPCANDPLRRRPTVAPTPSSPAAPETAPGAGSAPPPEDDCTGAAVTIKVRNVIDDPRGHGDDGEQPLPSESISPTNTPSASAGPSGSPG